MTSNVPVTPETLERYRSYLQLIARLHIPAALQRKLDPSDIVQDTLVKALQYLDQFRGQSEAELAGWLRQILANTLANATRDLGRAKRDAGREVSIEQQVHDSSARIESFLVADQSSPSMAATRNEDLLQLATAIENLPEGQREAVTLYHLQEWPIDKVAEQLQKSPAAVAGLIKRGLRQIRTEMAGPPKS